MTESLSIPSTPDRLLRQCRPSHLVCSAPTGRTNDAKGHPSEANPLAKLGDDRPEPPSWCVRDSQRQSQPPLYTTVEVVEGADL